MIRPRSIGESVDNGRAGVATILESCHTSECDNISTRRAIVESRRDSEKYTNDSFLVKRQRGENPRISILMNINNL